MQDCSKCFISPTIHYLLLVDFILYTFFLLIWHLYFRRRLKIKPVLNKINFIAVSTDAAVFVACNNSMAASDPVPFNSTAVNFGNSWSSTDHKFILNGMKGLYLVGMSVATTSSYQIDYRLMIKDSVGTRKYASLVRSAATGRSIDLVGRDLLINLGSADELYVSSSHQIHGDNYKYTSLSVFRITDSMTEFPVAFSVARDDFAAGLLDPLPFNVELVNEGEHFTRTHYFLAPTAGIYYFAFSVGALELTGANVVLYKNDVPFVSIFDNTTNMDSTDTIGRSIMTTLDVGDTMHVVNNQNQIAWSSSNLETSFSGFLYEPVHDNPVSIK